jgi:hypothetical protein
VRKALNENPLVQVGLLAVLALVVGFLLITRMGSSGASSEPAPAAETSSSAAVAPAPSTESTAAAPAESAAPAAAEAAAAPSDTGGFVAGPGLPAKVADSYEAGDTVVVLILNRKGIDDRKLAKEVASAAKAGSGNAALFVVEAKDIADYSRIAEGVDVDRVPALVVIEPKSLAEGDLPEATVSYGYRGPQSIAQAVRDAGYKGPENLPYHPR